MIFRLEKSDILEVKRILLYRIVGIIWVIFILNFIAGKLYLYSLIWWFDMPMHFFGGIFLAFLCIWLFLKFNLIKYVKNRETFLFTIIITVIFIGIFWELFEFGNSVFITFDKLNILDTLSDLFFDLSGGLFGSFYTLRKIQKFIVNKKIEV